jgi:hypothetical protein
MYLTAIDPATRLVDNAYADFQNGGLCGAHFGGSFSFSPRVIVYEEPQLDGRTLAVGATTTLQLALSVGRAVGRLERGNVEVHAYTPTQWKGSEPKPQNHARLWDVLTPAERLVLGGDATYRQIDKALEKGALCRWSKRGAEYYPRTFKTHNLLDAAALGCFHLGRLTKVG